MIKKLFNLFTPALLAVLMFFSNFLSTDLFEIGFRNFTVWFILSIFAFACGWLINKTLGWSYGGKVVFAVIVSTVVVSLAIVSYFNEYFGLSELISENLILYTLRNITLGAMGIFGMAVSEVIRLERECVSLEEFKKKEEETLKDASEKAKLLVEQAELKAEKILFDAEKKSSEMTEAKKYTEAELIKLIKTEIELLKKYDD